MAKWHKRRIWLSLITAVAIFYGCSTSQSIRITKDTTNSRGAEIIAISEQLIGAPYRYGGESPSGFDCSGLVRYVYSQVGITLPHSSSLLYQQSKRVQLGTLQPGDLLFFNISKNKISHVGIYSAEGEFIHAPSTGKGVSVASLNNPYWKNKLVAAGRLL